MKISTRQDIEAPLDSVYAAVTDFGAIERQLRKRGVTLERDPSAPGEGVGRRWLAEVSWRGRAHPVASELTAMTPGRGIEVVSTSGGVVCATVVDLVALSRTRTRMLVSVEARPTTISSRLLVQSLKLAKGRLTERLEARAGDFARRIESGTV